VTATLAQLRGPEYRRLFSAARRSLERTGADLTGQVSVAEPDDAERKALIGLTGQYRPAGVKRVTVSLATLDAFTHAALGLTLPEAIAAIDGKPLRHRPAERATLTAARAAARGRAEASPLFASRSWFRTWLDEIGPVVTRLVNQDGVARLDEAVRVLEAIERRTDDQLPYLLPALAEQATGDTKALGRGTTTATLVLRALALREQTPVPASAEEIRLLWDACGVVVDDLASRVLVLNMLASGDGLGSWLADAKRYGTPFQVTLHQLTVHPIRVQASDVFVCENPAILRKAAQQLGPACPPILCTEGRASTAFHRIAHLVTADGSLLKYHGDFDWDGVDMANQIITRHGAQPWLMTRADYSAAVRTDGDGIALRGKPRATPWEPDLAEAMAQAGVAVFEEAVADSLIAALAAPAP
jgi:uncharacterized protein (TIGR02679 family)